VRLGWRGAIVRRAVERQPSQLTVLRGIITLIIPTYPDLDAATRASVEGDVTRYVASQIQGMPGFLRLPYQVALVAFDWLALLRYARPFHRLRADQQFLYLGVWSDGPLAPMRDFIKLIRSTGLLVYFDHPLVLQHLEAERTSAMRESQSADERGRWNDAGKQAPLARASSGTGEG